MTTLAEYRAIDAADKITFLREVAAYALSPYVEVEDREDRLDTVLESLIEVDGRKVALREAAETLDHAASRYGYETIWSQAADRIRALADRDI